MENQLAAKLETFEITPEELDQIGDAALFQAIEAIIRPGNGRDGETAMHQNHQSHSNIPIGNHCESLLTI